MTNGAETGTSGRVPWKAPRWVLWSYAGAALTGPAIMLVNASTAMADRPQLYPQGVVTPLVMEATSVLAVWALLPLVWRIVAFAPPEPGGWRRFAVVQVLATIPFSLLHVILLDVFRWAAMKLSALPVCCAGSAEFLYEFRKDVLTYAVIVGLMGGLRLLDLLNAREGGPGTPGGDAGEAAGAAPILIRDGSRTLRVQPGELAAVRAAGNYVEHLFADGRAVLERATLAEAQDRLAPHGFLRTHRSWLVNPAAVREIAREGSGDRTLTLAGGVTAPVSRRYAEALIGLTER